MTARDRKRHEYQVRLDGEAAAGSQDSEDVRDAPPSSRALRQQHQGRWVDLQIQQAIRRGEFDNLPGNGQPIPGIDAPHDPDWWLKRLIERERISVLPPALALRKEHAQMDDTLDAQTTPDGVRRVLEDFNARIIDARRQLQGGPPVVTPLRDVDAEIEAWSSRRSDRLAQQKARLAQMRATEAAATPLSWWRRLRRGSR